MKKRIRTLKYLIIYLGLFGILSIMNLVYNEIIFIRFVPRLALISKFYWFFIIDLVILIFLFKYLKREDYAIQQQVLLQFRFILGPIILIGTFCLSLSPLSALFTSIINLFNHQLLVFFLAPRTMDPKVTNGIEEYFNKYPEKNKTRYYRNQKEIDNDYSPLKDEIKNEISALNVVVKDHHKRNVKKICLIVFGTAIPIIFLTGISYSIVEALKNFSRVHYNYFEVFINDERLDVHYSEEYHRTIIPFVYHQHESRNFNYDENVNNNVIKDSTNYIIDLKEYKCINQKNDRISCGVDALYEYKKEIESSKIAMEIYYDDELLYEGNFMRNITSYLPRAGTYHIVLKNRHQYLTTEINIKIIKEDSAF